MSSVATSSFLLIAQIVSWAGAPPAKAAVVIVLAELPVFVMASTSTREVLANCTFRTFPLSSTKLAVSS